jgi:diguanylate cyclase (GGDEF)-like protein
VDVSLASLLDRALASRWYVLRFGMPLERWYNEDTAQARLRYVTTIVTIGALALMLFLISDYALIPDMVAQAVLLRGVATILMVTAGLFWIHRTKSVAVREGIVVAFGLLAQLISVYLMIESRSPHRGSYLGSAFLIMLYVNIVAQPRFSYAVIATAGSLAAVLVGVMLISSIAAPVRLWLAGMNIIAGALTLVANFQLERQARRHYLMTMQEQLRSEHLATNNFELKSLSEEDPLTGLYNRRALEQRVRDLFLRSEFTQSPVSVLMIDVDRFKAFNDHFGHPKGDRCLQRIAATLIQEIRGGSDLVARYGGEEFIIVMPDTGFAGAVATAERIRLAIEACGIPSAPLQDIGVPLVVTASVGVATCEHPAGQVATGCPGTLADLIRRADECLYKAKATGRNRVNCG